eukprot:Colp12_sorted_trinity150504_noHs@28834
MDLFNATKEDIRQYFHATFSQYEDLFTVIADEESFFVRPDSLRHPLIFYYGHTAVFFINKLILRKYITQRINPRFEALLAVGVDEMSWDDLNVARYDWPTVAEVREYRNTVRKAIEDFIQGLPEKEQGVGIGWESPYWIIMMGIEHERIHLETSSVLIRQLEIQRVKQQPSWPVCPKSGDAPENELVEIPAGHVSLTRSSEGNQQFYRWDNEYGEHEVDVPGFKASKYLVSNREFLGFVEAGGYQNESLWTDEGWRWKTYRQREYPLFWIKTADGWMFRTMASEIAMPWDWPVEVNYLEAKAFCNWKGGNTRLPTEDEWYLLHQSQAKSAGPKGMIANIDLKQYASSVPVSANKHGELFDVVGNVWQWTETPIDGYKGFQVHPAYDDFSVPTYDGRHNLIKGGSWISTGNEAMFDSRYAFRRHFFQHAGFRYIVSEAPVPESEDNTYEMDQEISQLCEYNYGAKNLGVENFPKRLADLCSRLLATRSCESGFILGCTAGRSAFELAGTVPNLTATDVTARYIQTAVKMQTRGTVRYAIKDEGEIFSYKEARVQLGENSVSFMQADPSNLDKKYTGYDFVLAENIIDRIYNPRNFLANIHTRINASGLLIIASAYDWSEKLTPKQNWVGGCNGRESFDVLSEILSANFRLVEEPVDMEYVMRDTRRKFTYKLAQVSVWEKKESGAHSPVFVDR